MIVNNNDVTVSLVYLNLKSPKPTVVTVVDAKYHDSKKDFSSSTDKIAAGTSVVIEYVTSIVPKVENVLKFKCVLFVSITVV